MKEVDKLKIEKFTSHRYRIIVRKTKGEPHELYYPQRRVLFFWIPIKRIAVHSIPEVWVNYYTTWLEAMMAIHNHQQKEENKRLEKTYYI